MSAISCWTRNRLLSVWTSLRRFESEVLVISLRGSCWAMDLPRPKNSLERKITIKLIAETGGGRTSGRNNGPVPWAGELRMPGRAGGGEWRTVVTSWADCVPPPTETIQSYFASPVSSMMEMEVRQSMNDKYEILDIVPFISHLSKYKLYQSFNWILQIEYSQLYSYFWNTLDYRYLGYVTCLSCLGFVLYNEPPVSRQQPTSSAGLMVAA